MWTSFMDMHSGGGLKEGKYGRIYIEAPEAEAKVIFYNRFDHNPSRVSCTCCGEDYSISEYDTLEHATAFDRGCSWDEETRQYVENGEDQKHTWHKYRPLDQYLQEEAETVLLIYASEIKPGERTGAIPEQGYVWID